MRRVGVSQTLARLLVWTQNPIHITTNRNNYQNSEFKHLKSWSGNRMFTILFGTRMLFDKPIQQQLRPLDFGHYALPQLDSALPPGLEPTRRSRMDSGQRGSRSCCSGSTGRACRGVPTDKPRPRRANCHHGSRGASPCWDRQDR